MKRVSIGILVIAACGGSDSTAPSPSNVPDAGSSHDAASSSISDAGSPVEDGASDAAPDADIDAGPPPTVEPIAAIVIPENTIEQPTVEKGFKVDDPSGSFAGGTVTASAADSSRVQIGTVACTGDGTCTVSVKVIPNAQGTIAVTLTAKNARGAVGSGKFNVQIGAHVVSTGDDSGPGSLRSIVANSTPGDVIRFDASVTKVSLATTLTIGLPLSIIGPEAASLTIDGGATYQMITTTADPVRVSALTIAHGSIGIAATSGTVVVDSCTFSSNAAIGLDVIAGGGHTTAAHVSNSTFTNSGNEGALVMFNNTTDTGTAHLDVVDSTFKTNVRGLAAVTNGAGQTAELVLNGGNVVQSNTYAGIDLEIDNSAGTPKLAMPGAGGTGNNSITGNAVGVKRDGPVNAGAMTISPATQVSSNTTNFSPTWP